MGIKSRAKQFFFLVAQYPKASTPKDSVLVRYSVWAIDCESAGYNLTRYLHQKGLFLCGRQLLSDEEIEEKYGLGDENIVKLKEDEECGD